MKDALVHDCCETTIRTFYERETNFHLAYVTTGLGFLYGQRNLA